MPFGEVLCDAAAEEDDAAAAAFDNLTPTAAFVDSNFFVMKSMGKLCANNCQAKFQYSVALVIRNSDDVNCATPDAEACTDGGVANSRVNSLCNTRGGKYSHEMGDEAATLIGEMVQRNSDSGVRALAASIDADVAAVGVRAVNDCAETNDVSPALVDSSDDVSA